MNSEVLYIDLAKDYVSTMALLADKALPVDVFAEKYAALIQEHYQARGQDHDEQAVYREAADLHAYLLGLEGTSH